MMEHTDYDCFMDISSDASLDKIKAAYRQLSSRHNTDITALADAEKLFKALSQAHGVLKDPQVRAMYDIYIYLSQHHTALKPNSTSESNRTSQYHSALSRSVSISRRLLFVIVPIMLLISALVANHVFTHQDINALEETSLTIDVEADVVKEILETETLATKK